MTTIARAWAISRSDGLILGFTDHDDELHFDGIRFRPDSGMTARALVQAAGLSVDNSEAVGALGDDAITEADLMAGRWDGAGVRMWEVDWREPVQRRLIFRGTLGEVAHASGEFRAELRGLAEPLAAAQGRVFHPRCAAKLGDAACGVRLAGEALCADVTAEVVKDNRLFRFTDFPAYAPGWFDCGLLQVQDGAAMGLQRAIRHDTILPDGGREVELWRALGAAVQPGDRLKLTAGCNKQAVTCRRKFGNFLNFRGFPHLPPEDWLIAPHTAGGAYG